MADPFHEGERKMQALTGETEGAERNAPMIAPRIMSGAAPFLSSRFFAALGFEHDDQIWCDWLLGDPGFVSVPNQTNLRFDLSRVYEPLNPSILEAAKSLKSAGSLFIDLERRIRYRINGTLALASRHVLELRVREAFGNCPKYITRRSLQWVREEVETTPRSHGKALSRHAMAILRKTDLFFMATSHPDRGLDASHRGGNPGFVTVLNSRTIQFPDYPGNSLYNSLGNLLVDNRLGILVPDLQNRIALRITGTASVHFNDAVPDWTTDRAPRMVEVSVERWEETSLPLRSVGFTEYSPYNP